MGEPQGRTEVAGEGADADAAQKDVEDLGSEDATCGGRLKAGADSVKGRNRPMVTLTSFASRIGPLLVAGSAAPLGMPLLIVMTLQRSKLRLMGRHGAGRGSKQETKWTEREVRQ